MQMYAKLGKALPARLSGAGGWLSGRVGSDEEAIPLEVSQESLPSIPERILGNTSHNLRRFMQISAANL